MNRLSLNQRTTRRWSLRDAVDGCLRHGIPAIGVWREKIHEIGLVSAERLLTGSGLRVSSLCRGGFLTMGEGLDDNRRAIEEAARIGAACLVLVVGGLPEGSRDLPGARARAADAVAELAPFAAEHGVRLAIEPLHPMYCADRAVVSTLWQALDEFAVDVVVDSFHVWWDPRVLYDIARAGPRVAAFQVCDFLVPLPADVLLGRGMMGDGVIDFRALRRAVEAAGYTGDIEVEIFNAEVWRADPDDVLVRMKRSFAEHVLDQEGPDD